jgi:hypothetical protein
MIIGIFDFQLKIGIRQSAIVNPDFFIVFAVIIRYNSADTGTVSLVRSGKDAVFS